MKISKLSLTALVLIHVVIRVDAQVLNSENLRTIGLASANVNDIFSQSTDIFFFADAPELPLNLYSSHQKKALQYIDENIIASVMVDTTKSDLSEWTIIDREEITPLNWVWVDLIQLHAKDDSTIISLRRPVWWLKDLGVKEVGSCIYLNLPEMNIVGYTTVTNIRPSYIDTRVWPSNKSEIKEYPITGKFVHKSRNVYELKFETTGKVIQVTGSHPFWSVTRNQWIAAQNLECSEFIKCSKGMVRLSGKKKVEGLFKVYNLEVYRAHNFFVSDKALLVHNACMDWSIDFISMVERVTNLRSQLSNKFLYKGSQVSWVKETINGNNYYVIGLFDGELQGKNVNELIKNLVSQADIDVNDASTRIRIVGLPGEATKQLVKQGGYGSLNEVMMGKKGRTEAVELFTDDVAEFGWTSPNE